MAANERYQRQLLISQVGEAGQDRWRSSRILVVGAGGLGCPLLLALAGAGVGSITIMDGDVVSPGNLNRQYLYTPQEIGQSKAVQAAQRLHVFAPELTIQAIPEHLTWLNAAEALCGYDLVVPAVDNLAARLLINEVCAKSRTPLVNGGVDGLDGSVMTVEFGKTPCLACLYAGREEEQGSGAALGAVCMTVASLMAHAALWLLLGKNPIAGKLLLYDGRNFTTELLPLMPLPECPVCGDLF